MTDNNRKINTKTLAETDNYIIWQAEEPEREAVARIWFEGMIPFAFHGIWQASK